MNKTSYSRRKFLLTGAVAASGLAALGLPDNAVQFAKTDPVQVGVIGTGGRGLGIVRVLKEMPNVEVKACCDLIPDRLQEALKYAAKGAKAFTDYS